MPLETEFPEAEVLEQGPEFLSAGALAQINASEINQMVATAKQFPRNLAKVRKQAYHLITNNEETAASCSYAIPRDGKVITGPSVRFAEILFSSWQNCRVNSRVVEEGSEYITAQGMFYDVENNVAIGCEVRMRIVDKQGRRYSSDMIVNTANAAGSKASRTAILRGIPKAAWQWLYEEAQRVVAGDVKTLTQRRDRALELFKPFGITQAMACSILGVEGVSEITTDHLTTMQAILNALKEREVTVESLMQNAQNQKVAEKGEHTLDQIKAKYQKDAAAKAQQKLDAKRKAAKAQEPAKAAEVVETPKEEPKEEAPF